jgi:hypothetical protein
VTHLDGVTASTVLSLYAWRWGVEISQPHYDSSESLSLAAA